MYRKLSKLQIHSLYLENFRDEQATNIAKMAEGVGVTDFRAASRGVQRPFRRHIPLLIRNS